MRIILINLARAPERRQKMEKQFAALGLVFERLEATDGRSLSASERALVDNEKRRRFTPYPLSDNEIGCWLSHRRAMQDLVANGPAMAAIMEDDVELSPDFPQALRAIETLRMPFDAIDLHRKFRKNEIFVPCYPLLAGLQLGRIGYSHMGALGYIISREGARKFLEYAPRFVHAVDKEMRRYWANGLDIYGLERPVVKDADAGISYIEETRGQEWAEGRPRYPRSDSLYWRGVRGLTKLCDSLHKRVIFPFYVKRARQNAGASLHR